MRDPLSKEVILALLYNIQLSLCAKPVPRTFVFRAFLACLTRTGVGDLWWLLLCLPALGDFALCLPALGDFVPEFCSVTVDFPHLLTPTTISSSTNSFPFFMSWRPPFICSASSAHKFAYAIVDHVRGKVK